MAAVGQEAFVRPGALQASGPGGVCAHRGFLWAMCASVVSRVLYVPSTVCGPGVRLFARKVLCGQRVFYGPGGVYALRGCVD